MYVSVCIPYLPGPVKSSARPGLKWHKGRIADQTGLKKIPHVVNSHVKVVLDP